MKILLTIFMLAFTFINGDNIPNLDFIRKNYRKAVKDKALCRMMIDKLQLKEDSNIYVAYLGGFQTIWANHVINPLSKLNSFNTGKKNIEKAIKNESGSIEIHFIRLSVQKNAPSFLGYNKNIVEDENYLKNNKHSIYSPLLLKQVNTLLNE